MEKSQRPHRLCSLVMIVATTVTITGCGDRELPLEVEHAPAPVTVSIPQGTLAVALPQGFAIQDIAIAATETLRIADRASVREPAGGRARVSNVGSTVTDLGVDALTGAVWSGGDVTLRGLNSRSIGANVIGDVTAAGRITLQNGARIQGTQRPGQAIAASQVPFPVTVPAASTTSKTVPVGGSLALGPGNYGEVHVFTGGTLTLAPGRYFVGSLLIEPNAHVVLQNASAPVYLYIRGSLLYNGAFEEQATGELEGNVFVGMLGTSDVTLQAPFTGTIVAPNSTLTLATVTGGHTGSFFARSIEVRPDVVVTHKAFPSVLIDHVDLSKTDVCVNEPVTAAVSTVAEVSPVTTTIDLQVTDHRTFQFRGLPGPRYITVIVSGPNGTLESRTVTINLKDCGTAFAGAALVVRPSLYDLNSAEFRVLNPDEIQGANRSFVWTFGDGTSATTTVPYAEHSYDAAVGTDEEYDVFDASLRVVRSGHPDIVVPKTVTLWNRYAVIKHKGLLQPRAEGAEHATLSGPTYTADIAIQNKEATALPFSQEVIERQFCDPDRDSDTLGPRAITFSVPPHGTAIYTASVNKADFGPEVCGFGVTLTGQAGTRNVIAVRSFETRPNTLFGRQVTDPATQAILDRVRSGGFVSGDAITGRDLERLFKQGQIPALPATSNLFPGALGDPGGDPAGQPCIPGDDRPRPGLACLVSAGEPDTCYGPQVVNAQKGDLLLVASCEDVGLLLRQVSPPQHYSHEGIMTTNRYRVSHSTRSSQEVIDKFKADHAWSSDFLRYGWPGMLHESIATAFNGNTVNRNGTFYTFVGFSQDATRCEGDESLNPPLVVKPFPGTEAQVRPLLETAANLAAGAETHYRFYAFSNAAIGLDSAFDVPASLQGSVGESGPATVSSQSLWRVLKLAGATLEGPTVESGDRQIDAQTQDGLYVYTEQERRAAGMWFSNHTANKIDEQVPDAIRFLSPGGFAGLQLADCFAADVCGIDDACRLTDSPAQCCDPNTDPGCVSALGVMDNILANPGIGRAVAPDDFFSWDAPHRENGALVGAYGYAEQLHYSSGECLPTTRWQAAPDTGTLTAVVHDETGAAVRDALVLVDGAEVRTGADGSVTIPGVSAGTELVEAQCGKPRDGTIGGVGCDRTSSTFLSATATVVVPANGQATVTLTIVGTPENRRRVAFDFNVWINDDDFGDPDECGIWGNFPGHGNCDQHPTPIHAECDVDPLHPIAEFHDVFDECVDSEVRGTIEVKCVLDPDAGNPAIQRNVHTFVRIHLFEGSSCNGDETDASPIGRDDEIGPDAGIAISGMFISDESFPSNGSPFDRIEISYTATNTVQP